MGEEERFLCAVVVRMKENVCMNGVAGKGHARWWCKSCLYGDYSGGGLERELV